MPSRLYDIAAGEELGPGSICQHNGKVPCELRRLPSGNLPPVELDRAGKRYQMACDGFKMVDLPEPFRPDERHDVARANLQLDAFDYDLLVVARRQVAYAESGAPSACVFTGVSRFDSPPSVLGRGTNSPIYLTRFFNMSAITTAREDGR